MPADIIYADFASKTYHKLTLEEQAAHLVKEFNSMAESGTEVICVMDTAPSEMPPQDSA